MPKGLWRKSKCLNRQEFVIVGWTDPEGSRSDLGALLLGYHTGDGKLVYAGRVGTGMPDKVLADLPPPFGTFGPPEFAAQRAAAPQGSLRIAARSFPSALGRAATRCRDHLSDLDRRRGYCAIQFMSGSDPTSRLERFGGKRRARDSGLLRRRNSPINSLRLGEQVLRNRDLAHLERDIAPMADDLRADPNRR